MNGDWPPQIVAGRVACIAKTACPVKALDFRPITVLGLLYRCWSTYQAKFAIKKLDAHLPTGLYGSRPRRYAGQVWSHLLWAIEHAYEQDIPLCGVMADIQKAFNFLPRLVVLECCAIVGLPFPILRAWAGALTIMERRFQINGAMSPPALSNCGLPEGCALSCVGMMVVDMVFHAWMVHFFPLCQPISYVDDWQILLMTPEAMLPAMQCLERFTQALDLLLDKTKTHAWSICKEGRSTMRDQGLDLVSYAKNLGPHVQFTRQHTNKTLVDRINDCQPLWIKLRLSACGYASKVRALRVAAWPRCLHGVAATSISLTHFAALRSSAMRGLGADAAGANPMVQLGVIEKPITDPHCWAITQTIRLTRDCGDPERVEQVMCEIVSGSDAFPSNSITQTLCARLQFLGWHVSESGQLVDMLGCFSLFTVSLAELQYRIDMHWIRVVAAATAHRQCFSGMENCDPGDTRDWLGSLSMPDQAIFRKILNGTHITQDGKMHCQETSVDTCPFCDCSDSRYHRFWECQRFETLRSHVSPETRKAICDLPEVLTCSGWSLMPTTMTEWNQYFVTLPVAAVPLCRFSGDVFLFTDGSCHAQHDIKRRFAARSVVQATCDCAHDLTGSQVLDAGPLPGLLQSAARAEVFAILRALQCAQTHVGRLFLWTDCSSVVRRLNRILAGHDVRPNSSHADLWLEIQIAVQNRKGPTFVAYVAAHQQLEDVHDFFTEWCFRHNSVADRQAVRANFTRDVPFWQLYYRHHSAVEVIYELNRTVQQVQLAISHEVLRQDTPVLIEPLHEPCCPVPGAVWRQLPTLQLPTAALRWYGDSLVRHITSWFWNALSGSTSPVSWVSHFQLYIDFMLATGRPGPVHTGRWQDGADIPMLTLYNFAFRRRARWFAKVLKETLRHMKVEVEAGYVKPASSMILMFTGSLAVPWPPERLLLIDEWLLQHGSRTFRRQTRAIDGLPFAACSAAFSPHVITSIGL